MIIFGEMIIYDASRVAGARSAATRAQIAQLAILAKFVRFASPSR
jgi:hypothetical protein